MKTIKNLTAKAIKNMNTVKGGSTDVVYPSGIKSLGEKNDVVTVRD